jgi:hemoglobin
MEERVLRCFDEALADVGIEGSLRTVLHDYFAWATRVHLAQWPDSAKDVPEGLTVPRSPWVGFQD